MPRKLVAIEVRTPDRATVVPPPSGEDLLSQLELYPHYVRRIDQVDTVSFSVKPGTPAATDPSYLTRRNVLRFIYDDSSFEEWRITQFVRDLTGEQPATVEAVHILADLSDRIVMHRLSTGTVMPGILLMGVTVQEALNALLSPDYNAPSLFAPGTVDPAFDGIRVSVVSEGNRSHLELLRELVQTVDARMRLSYDSSNDRYLVHFDPPPSAASAPVVGLGGGLGNRQGLTWRIDALDYYSRIVPVCGPPEERATIAEARWIIASGGLVGANTELTLKLPAVYRDDALNGLYVRDNYGNIHRVIDSIAPDRIVLPGTVALTSGDWVQFVADSNGSDLFYLPLPEAEAVNGVRERAYDRSDIPPVTNVLERNGVSVDLSTWSGGLPEGFSVVGGATVTQETDPQYVRYGTRSAKVTCPSAGDGLRTAGFVEVEGPYASVWISVRVAQGAVRLELVNSNSEINPGVPQIARSDADNLLALSISGLEPTTNQVYVQVVADADNTIFWLDALTLVNSASAYEYRPQMGPEGLWLAAANELVRSGGLQPDLFDVEAIDLAHVQSGVDEIELGKYVRIQDDWDPQTGTWRIDVTRQVIELEEEDHPLYGRLRKRFRLEKRQPSLSDRFTPGPARVAQAPVPSVLSVQKLSALAVNTGELRISGKIQGDNYELLPTELKAAAEDPDGIYFGGFRINFYRFSDNTLVARIYAPEHQADPGADLNIHVYNGVLKVLARAIFTNDIEVVGDAYAMTARLMDLTSDPPAESGWGILYVKGGALFYRAPDGTITQLA